ncbi:MAG: threonylcarbamoyl-AMP synthase [Chloroflexi bacterium]|nr:threonylcarbamoyl-AMP synthase [Chloroflexota bacterium]
MRRTVVLAVDPEQPEPAAIARAAQVLRRGGLVAIPTETVYGLAANAFDPEAVRSIFRAKERPRHDPLIVHLASAEELPRVARHVPPEAQRLAEAFWPGPLTLLLPRAPQVPSEVTAGLDTVGVRVPSHAVARAVIAAAGVPVAAPSANRFGHTSPTTAQHVLHDLDGRIDLVLDAGPTTVGVESTVLDLTSDPPRVLRPGGVPVEALAQVLEREVPVGASAGPARAPGQLLRHYAPRARLELFEGTPEATLHAIADQARRHLQQGKRVGLLLADEDVAALGALEPQEQVLVRPVGSRRDLAEIARRLYAELRRLDTQGPDVILARTFGTEGLGLAIADRLRRAAEGRVTRVRT